jgi:hypothetical protein
MTHPSVNLDFEVAPRFFKKKLWFPSVINLNFPENEGNVNGKTIGRKGKLTFGKQQGRDCT